MSEDVTPFLARLKLSEEDQIELRAVLTGECVTVMQILTGAVTLDELVEVGVRENVLEAIRKEIDEFQERKKAAEQKQVFFYTVSRTSFIC